MDTDKLIAMFRRDVERSERGRIGEIAEATGVSLKNLRNLYYGDTAIMEYENMAALASYYARRRK